MCNVAFAQMAQVVVGYAGQRQQARDVRTNALAAQDDAFAGIEAQQLQVNAHASDVATERSRQALQEAGTLSAIFADSGLSGASQERIKATAAGSAARDLDTIERNRQNRITQSNAEAGGVAVKTQSTINSVKHPSLIGAGLQIAVLDAERRNKVK